MRTKLNKQKGNVVLLVAFLAILFIFSGATLIKSFSTIKDHVQVVTSGTMREKLMEIEKLHRLSFYGKNQLDEIYRATQLGLKTRMTGESDPTKQPVQSQGRQANILSNTAPTQIERGNKYEIEIRVKNTGVIIWNEKTAIRLCIFQDGLDHGYRVYLPEGVDVKPNAEYTFVLQDFQAPPSDSTYLEFQMVEENIAYFGDKVRVDITVK